MNLPHDLQSQAAVTRCKANVLLACSSSTSQNTPDCCVQCHVSQGGLKVDGCEPNSVLTLVLTTFPRAAVYAALSSDMQCMCSDYATLCKGWRIHKALEGQQGAELLVAAWDRRPIRRSCAAADSVQWLQSGPSHGLGKCMPAGPMGLPQKAVVGSSLEYLIDDANMLSGL